MADFLAWCADIGVSSIFQVQPLHAAGRGELQTQNDAVPTVKQRLAAVRHLFDWLIIGQVVPANPAAAVRGPCHIVKTGKTPVLEPEEARALLDSIDVTTPAGQRDRADGLFFRADRRGAWTSLVLTVNSCSQGNCKYGLGGTSKPRSRRW
ncbi:MAG: hypothetical protein ACLPJJ_03660 [Acidocella sp.]|uniref:hypothetical protein n=1 Tax=Acidocella sp. TaxID=50710 RepID=UPI003FD7EEE9